MIQTIKLKNVIKFKKLYQIVIFLNGQLYYPYISQIFTSMSKLVNKPKYDFWVH